MKTNRPENLTTLLSESQGYVILYLTKGGKLESRLSGNTREIFDRLFDEKPAKQTAGSCRDCGKCSCTHQKEE